MNLKKIEFVEAKISPAFAQFVTDTCGNPECEYDNNLDAIEFYVGDVTDLLYSADSQVIMQANKGATAYTLRGTETTMNLIVARYVQHLEQLASNDDDLTELLN
ncbi:MAG: hypothetical protein WBI40_13035 [Methylococcaceae bacterium]